MRIPWLAISILSFAATANAAEPPADHLNFVGCPVVRDTQTVPCWLAEYEGELYYLGIQTDISADFDPPYLGHRVLVEGVVADSPRICGGIVLEPVVVSPMIEFDANCNTILPEEPRYTVPFAPRPPGPSGGRLAFDPPPGGAAAAPAAETAGRPGEFELHYDFDMLIQGRHAAVLTDIYNFAMQHSVRRIRVTGHAGATLLSNGQVLEEDPALALMRAQQVADYLAGAGLDDVPFEIVAENAPERPDGRSDWMHRSVAVVLEGARVGR
jgi:outer membrane protein OmpA-like peptidoglycan-associated protein